MQFSYQSCYQKVDSADEKSYYLHIFTINVDNNWNILGFGSMLMEFQVTGLVLIFVVNRLSSAIPHCLYG